MREARPHPSSRPRRPGFHPASALQERLAATALLTLARGRQASSQRGATQSRRRVCAFSRAPLPAAQRALDSVFSELLTRASAPRGTLPAPRAACAAACARPCGQLRRRVPVAGSSRTIGTSSLHALRIAALRSAHARRRRPRALPEGVVAGGPPRSRRAPSSCSSPVSVAVSVTCLAAGPAPGPARRRRRPLTPSRVWAPRPLAQIFLAFAQEPLRTHRSNAKKT